MKKLQNGTTVRDRYGKDLTVFEQRDNILITDDGERHATKVTAMVRGMEMFWVPEHKTWVTVPNRDDE